MQKYASLSDADTARQLLMELPPETAAAVIKDVMRARALSLKSDERITGLEEIYHATTDMMKQIFPNGNFVPILAIHQLKETLKQPYKWDESDKSWSINKDDLSEMVSNYARTDKAEAQNLKGSQLTSPIADYDFLKAFTDKASRAISTAQEERTARTLKNAYGLKMAELRKRKALSGEVIHIDRVREEATGTPSPAAGLA